MNYADLSGSSSPCCHVYLRAYCPNIYSLRVHVTEDITSPEQGCRATISLPRYGVSLGHVMMPAPIKSLFRNPISLSMRSSRIGRAFPKKSSSRGHFNKVVSSERDGLNIVRQEISVLIFILAIT